MTAPSPRQSTGTAEIKLAEAKVGLYARVGAGLFFMLIGVAIFAYALWSKSGVAGAPCGADNHTLMIVGGVVAIGGAMMLPSVFDGLKPVLVYVFPNGIPFFGGRRQGDPPAPPAP